MDEPTTRLPHAPPRKYTLRDAYRGRVWRTPLTVFARELFFWALGLALIAIALNHKDLMVTSAFAGGFLGLVALTASLRANGRRVSTIREGLPSKAILDTPRRVPFLHEIFRGQKESTYRMTYTFDTVEGVEIKGKIWLCGCARKYLPPGSIEAVAYDPENPKKSILLRVAMMIAPH